MFLVLLGLFLIVLSSGGLESRERRIFAPKFDILPHILCCFLWAIVPFPNALHSTGSQAYYEVQSSHFESCGPAEAYSKFVKFIVQVLFYNSFFIDRRFR